MGKKIISTKVFIIENHFLPGVFIARSYQDCIVTLNLVSGKTFYDEKILYAFLNGNMREFRVWNPFRSKIAASILAGIRSIYIKPGSTILYLGCSTGTTVSYCSDIIGKKGIVFAVEFSRTCFNQLLHISTIRKNIVPILEDVRFPNRYKMLIPLVDTIIMDISQPDQSRILGLNALFFLRYCGNFLLSLKISNIDTMTPKEITISKEIHKLSKLGFLIKEQISLEPYEKEHVILNGVYINR